MSADFNGRELSHLSDFDSPLDRIHREDHSELVKGSQSGLYTEEFKWIRRQLRVKLSEYSNDTMFHSVLMSRFYHKYSASQDYYYSNIVNNILSDTQTAPAIRWQDVQTELDDDEYLKRFYQVNEYDHKIKLLSEYYKFHKDIPRFFAQPTCRKLNEYHEKKRKIDYHRIKQILIEEAQKKNKRVAMNDDDNEIRLTDRDIEQSEGKDGQRNDNDADDNSESDSEDRRNPVTDQKMLPDYLIHSLYKDEQKRKRERERANARKNSSQKEDQSNSSIKDLHEKLKMIGQHIDESSIISGFDCENSRWEPKIDFGRKGEGFHPELAISKIDSSRQNGHKQSKTVCMQMLDEKAKNIKDVNLNINLNLRVLGDKNTCSSEYDCFIPRGLILKGSKDKLGSGLKPSTEFKRLAKNKKLFNSGIRCQFKKKNKPDELRVSSKDLSTESRVIRRANMRSHGRIDSENSLSQRKLPPGHLPVASMQIQNFSKLFTISGSEYKKAAASRSIRTRKSKNLENILTKYKTGNEKTLEPDSGKKDKSDKKTLSTARSRIGGSGLTEYIIRNKEPLLSARNTENPSSKGSSKSKVNFKRKKMSLPQQSNQNLSKEISKQGLNMDAACLYQTNNYKPSKKSSQKPNKNSDPIELIKEKYNGSMSSKTKQTQADNSALQNIVQSIGVKFHTHKLSLSNSMANYNLSQLKTLGIGGGTTNTATGNITNSQFNQATTVVNVPTSSQTGGDSKELRKSTSKSKKETRSRSKSGGLGQKITQMQTMPGPKFNRMLNLEIKKKPDLQEIGITKKHSSRGNLLKPPTSERERRSAVPSAPSNEKIMKSKPKINFANFERLHTAHGYSRSEVRPGLLSNPVPHPNTKNKTQASISASKAPSIHLTTKNTNK